MKKELEGKVRLQTQELPNQKNVAKVFVNPNALLEAGLSTGQVCLIQGPGGACRQGIVWPSPEKSIARNVVSLSRRLLKAAGLQLGDLVRVSDGGDVPDAERVVMRDTTADAPPLDARTQGAWECILEDSLSECDG